MKKAIVIGGGVSGLSIAARLLYKGFNVEIYEKNKHIGGKTNFLTLGDFRFDLTASLIMMPNDYIQVFTDCNKNFKDYFTIKPINTLYKVFYYDGTYYDFKTSLPQLCKTIDNISIELSIPNNWHYEEISQDEENDYYKFALKLYKNEESKNAVLYFYNNPFGVCGTGRTTEKIYLNNGTEAVVGYYDNSENWSDVSFYKLNHNIALINCGLEGAEAKEVLEFIKTINIE